jgi:transmembrane sensor
MTEEEIKLLLERYASDLCTPDEKEWVEAWLRHEATQSDWSWKNKSHVQNVKQRIAAKIEQQLPISIRKRTPFNYWLTGIAATFLLIVMSVVFLQQNGPEQLNAQNIIALPEQIGGPELTMANGTVVDLADLKEGTTNRQGRASIKKLEGNSLIYSYQNNMGAEPIEKQFNRLRIPAGTSYQLVLPDGSKVWLNACSELSFPTVFDKESREVSLKGEAYFEVARQSKQPFIVEANGSQISVIGTAFNVSAYQDEEKVITTLTEGAVAVSLNNHSLILKPNEQATADLTNHRIGKAQVDPEVFLAWKSDYFVFDDLDIKSIMHQISRWYNIEVVFQGNIPTKKFGGTFSRSKPIEELLAYLEQLGNIRFKLNNISFMQKERRIIVMP